MIKPLISIFFIVLCTNVCFGQTSDTSIIYIDAYSQVVKQQKADRILKAYQKDSKSYIFAMYSKNNVLIQKETYADPELKIMHGPYAEYTNGKLTLRGFYLNNKREGNFVSYDTLGIITVVKAFQRDSLFGPTVSYYQDGQIKEEKIYSQQEKLSQDTWYYENGHMAIKEVFSKGVRTDSIYLDLEGNPTKKKNIFSDAEFPGGITKFYKFIGQSLRYPPDALDKGVQGSVIISYDITEKGTLENVKVDRKLFPSIDWEALRVVKLSPRWIPAKIMGRPTRTNYVIPIRLSTSP